MRIQVNKPLFAGECLEDSPTTLKAIEQLVDVIPDEDLLTSLETTRGKGRNTPPR